eukprot:3941089-Rhodomonas_salina.2
MCERLSGSDVVCWGCRRDCCRSTRAMGRGISRSGSRTSSSRNCENEQASASDNKKARKKGRGGQRSNSTGDASVTFIAAVWH